MSQLENIKSPLEFRTELHKMVVADLLGTAGGEDLKLGSHFYETVPEVQFTVSESARREVLSRLLKLNYEN